MAASLKISTPKYNVNAKEFVPSSPPAPFSKITGFSDESRIVKLETPKPYASVVSKPRTFLSRNQNAPN